MLFLMIFRFAGHICGAEEKTLSTIFRIVCFVVYANASVEDECWTGDVIPNSYYNMNLKYF